MKGIFLFELQIFLIELQIKFRNWFFLYSIYDLNLKKILNRFKK
jgi:hypothetical protein